MPTSYVYDPALNLDKCLLNTLPLNTSVDNLSTLPKDWLTQLENICQRVKPDLEKNIFFKHVGPNSNYKLKTILLEQLSLIYCGVRDNLQSELSKLLLHELIEDIQQCTPGFHIRVNKLANSFQTPNTLEQLLYLVRKSIVQGIACSLMSSVDPIYQVHVANRVCRIAKKQGLGIEPDLQKDQYKSLLSGQSIRQLLKDKFPEQFTAFKLPFLLTEQLQLILSLHHYQGPKEEYYNSETAESMVLVIKKFFSLTDIQNRHFKDFFILQLDPFEDPTLFYDIDWSLIRQYFFQLLSLKGYFTKEPQIVNLIDYAYYKALLPEKSSLELENRYINYYLNNQNYTTLLDDLILIQNKFPDYWKKLTKNSFIISNINTFFDFLMENPCEDNAKKTLKRLNHTYTLFFSQSSQFILRKIFRTTNPGIKDISHHFLLKSVQYRPEITSEIFNHLFKNIYNSYQLFFDLLLKKNSDGFNLVMLAGKYHTETLHFILNVLSQHIDHFEREKVLELLLNHTNDGWNFISLAARHRTDAMKLIFEFINSIPFYLDLEILSQLFTQKCNSTWSFFCLLACYQTDTEVNFCLDFISQKFEHSKNKKWLALVLSQSMGGILRLAAQSNLNALSSFLNFINRHSEQIESNTFSNFFLDCNKAHASCLHIAARYWPNNLPLILNCISKNIGKLRSSAIRDLFLAQNSTSHNFLMLAANFQPATIEFVLEFMNKQSQIFDKETLKTLFLQQNSYGWNFLGAAHNQADNIQRILNFLGNKLDLETLRRIIFQKTNMTTAAYILLSAFNRTVQKIF